MKILTFLLLLCAAPAFGTITASSTNCVVTQATSQNPPITFTNNVPAGASIVVGFSNRTNNTEVVSSVSDGTNANYSEASVSTNGGGSTGRQHLYYINNSAALTTPTVTINWQTNSISTQIHACWLSSNLGAMTFDGAAVAAQFATATQISSNTIAVTGAGGIVGFAGFNNAQASAPTDLGTDEIVFKFDSALASRTVTFFQPYASGTPGFEGGTGGIDLASSANGAFLAAAFKEAVAGGTVVNPISGRGGAAAQPIIH